MEPRDDDMDEPRDDDMDYEDQDAEPTLKAPGDEGPTGITAPTDDDTDKDS